MSKKNIIFTHIKKTSGTSLYRALDLSNYYEIKARSTFAFFFKTLYKRPFILTGHRPYGVHKKIIPRAEYITMLAPPVERYVSEFFFAKQSKYPNYEHPNWADTERYDIIECLEKGILKDNVLVRNISGTVNSTIDKSDLAVAKYNLKNKYAVFGLKTHFEASCKRIANFLQVDYSISTTKHKKTKKEMLSDNKRSKIAAYHKFDIEFYKFATDLFYANSN